MPTISFFTRLLDAVPAAQRYRLAIEQIEQAERVGLHRAWVAQHHFHEQEGGLPSPFVFLARVAATTSRIRLGTGIVTLPLENPVRVAEDAIVADLLADGRIDLGVGSGTNPSSFIPFGVDAADKARVYRDGLATLHAGLAGGDVGGGNRLYPAGRALRERVWQATFSVSGGVSAGENGNGLLLSRTQPRDPAHPDATLAQVQEPIIDAYLEHLPAGVAPRITASRTVFVADDRDEALRFAEQGLRRVADFIERSGRTIDTSSVEALAEGLDTFVGTPDDVAAALAADATLRRVDEVALQVHSVDPPHDFILRSIELSATEVAPRLGWAASPTALTVGGR